MSNMRFLLRVIAGVNLSALAASFFYIVFLLPGHRPECDGFLSAGSTGLQAFAVLSVWLFSSMAVSVLALRKDI